MRPQDRGAGPHDVPALAADVARRAHGCQAAPGGGQIPGGCERTLTGRLAGPVHIKDDEAVALLIQESAHLRSRKAVLGEIGVEEATQGGQAGGVDVGEEAAEGRAMRQASPAEEGHEGVGAGSQPVEEGLQGGLATGGVAEQHGHKVDDLIEAGPTARHVHLGTECVQQTVLGEAPRQDDHLWKPGGNGRNFSRAGVQAHGRCGE